MVNAQEFLQDVRQWQHEDLVFSENINQEARGNLCCLSISAELAQEITAYELTKVIEAICAGWRSKLSQHGQESATFYVYLDEQASQLRFSLISGDATPLPFGCTVNDTATLEEVVSSFLAWPYLDGFPCSELHEPDGSPEIIPVAYVYRKALYASAD